MGWRNLPKDLSEEVLDWQHMETNSKWLAQSFKTWDKYLKRKWGRLLLQERRPFWKSYAVRARNIETEEASTANELLEIFEEIDLEEGGRNDFVDGDDAPILENN